jgi:hypothetical protein
MTGFRFGTLLLSLIFAGTVSAQNGKFTATVKLDKMEMRAGHSWQFPKVGELKKGEQVLVHHEEDHWVAIYPPPGSVSWIQARFLDRVDPHQTRQNVAVIVDPSMQAEVHVVAPTAPKEVNRIYQVKLPRGTIVEVLGGAVPVKDETSSTSWYPITPPEGEYRWIPRQAIGDPTPAAPPPQFVQNDTQNAKTVALRGDPRNPPTGSSVNAAQSAPMLPEYEKAEQAEKAGNYALAEEMYTRCYYKYRGQGGDHELATVCYNRIVACQQRQKLEGATPRTNAPPPPSNGYNPPAASISGPTNTTQTSNPFTTSSGNTNTAAQDPAPGQTWTGPGILRRAGSPIDDKPAYALMDSKGKIICYATATPGIDLDRYLNLSVSLLGRLETRGTIRGGPYMVATQVK